MLEKRFYAVPPQLFTADGTTSGVVTVAANACALFKVKQKIYLSASGLPDLQLEIKEIDSEENIQVGPIAGTLKVPGANTGISARTNISAYTVALGAAIFAVEQKRPAIDNIEIVRATYQEEPTCAVRSIMVDDCGSTFGSDNPFPTTTNIVPESNIPFTLTALTLPNLVSQYTSGLTYNQVTSDTVGDEEVLRFYESGTPVGEILLTKKPDGWSLNLGVPVESFLLLETGDFFELEDSSGGIELE